MEMTSVINVIHRIASFASVEVYFRHGSRDQSGPEPKYLHHWREVRGNLASIVRSMADRYISALFLHIPQRVTVRIVDVELASAPALLDGTLVHHGGGVGVARCLKPALEIGLEETIYVI